MSVNQKVYAAIVAMSTNIVGLESSRSQVKQLTKGAYDMGIAAAAMAKDGEDFAEAMDLVCDNIQFGRDDLHVKFSAPERTRADGKGRKYKLPQSIMNIRSLCKSAFERGVPFKLDGKLRSYTDVQKEVRAKGEAADIEEAKKLEGRPRLEYDTRALFAKLADALPKIPEATLKALHDSLSAVVIPATESPAQAVVKATEAAKPQAPATEAAAPARPARKGRKPTTAERLAA